MSELIMFDFGAFYHRMARELPYDCKIVECGVANGDSALYLAQRLKDLDKPFKLYMVDNCDYGSLFQLKTIYENIIKSGLGEYIEVIPKASLDAAKDFNDGFLDFCFIDSSHTYPETRNEIYAWYDKIKDGGTLAGHDWNAPEVNRSVIEAIPETVQRNDIPDRDFPVEQFLYTEQTDRGYGLWHCTKNFYKKLNSKP